MNKNLIAIRELLNSLFKSFTFYRFIFVVSFLSFLFSFVSTISYLLLEGSFYSVFETGKAVPQFHKSIGEYASALMVGVVLAPLAETFLFHFLLILILKKFIKYNFIVVLISSVLFGLAHHSEDVINMIMPFFSGIIFSYTFLYWYKKTNSKKKGFEATMGVHAGHNLYFFLISLLPF